MSFVCLFPPTFRSTTIDGEARRARRLRGKALLIVNVASKCGFTPQYGGWRRCTSGSAERGFAVLGFPCDQFGHQEPGDEAEIDSFCSLTYDVSFPMFAKIEVNGDDAHPLFKRLKQAGAGPFGTEGIKWNFTKFLLDRESRRGAPLRADRQAGEARRRYRGRARLNAFGLPSCRSGASHVRQSAPCYPAVRAASAAPARSSLPRTAGRSASTIARTPRRLTQSSRRSPRRAAAPSRSRAMYRPKPTRSRCSTLRQRRSGR